MKIYSDHLTRGNIIANAPQGTYVAECDIVYGIGDEKVTKRRRRKNCFRVILSGSNSRQVMGNPEIKAATYDEWGFFLAEIFRDDEEAICGPYADAHDFHEKTEYKFHRTCKSCDKPIYTGLDYCGAALCAGEVY